MFTGIKATIKSYLCSPFLTSRKIISKIWKVEIACKKLSQRDAESTAVSKDVQQHFLVSSNENCWNWLKRNCIGRAEGDYCTLGASHAKDLVGPCISCD
ncbi:hypothetical protein scyTo_0005962 [Scyliorhinus torazame]|uniref:Uncharacterized protein n=1 Tax=Scyliorhinus torazame TaxID=75743 RepID=A0A401PEH1_SCYTO|nr:hypothetical protein [Scyliorhinus torazame]